MTQIQRYLAEEIAEEHADGLVSRREALRRLGLLGLRGAAAASLLAAFLADEARARVPVLAGAGATAPSSAGAEAAARPTREIVFRGPGGRKLRGAWAAAARPRGGVLVIHENRGLTDSIRTIAGRLAASGYSALAIDLLSEEGGTASFSDEFEAMAALGAAPASRFVADLKAGVTEIRRRLPGKKVAATGFCFGGGMTWSLLASKESRLAAAVPFYGPFPEGGNLAGSKAAVLGIYAELDSRVNATRAAARAALRKAGLRHQIVTYPGVDHAFFNPTGARHDPAAAAAAYRRLVTWFGTYVAGA
ncbi:MAG TPA: dienelactone hydrolase family protein [Solirubrobacteraceae bacterium]|nr:dienelactone hydrolase family protein [Solirubrobacteraceae bacterium]